MSVAGFYDGVELVLVVHFLPYLGTHRRQTQAADEVHHVGVILVQMLVQTDNLLTVGRTLRLVEYAKDLVQTVVYLPLQQGYLNDDAVVYQTVDEGVLLAVFHNVTVVV